MTRRLFLAVLGVWIADGVLDVANAAADGSPAYQQKYYRFDIRSLMRARPKPER